jgi:hypothetical protein
VVKNLFKSIVVRRGETMEEVICGLMRKYIADPTCVARWEKKRRKPKKKKEKKKK